jgi:hypothetical protein
MLEPLTPNVWTVLINFKGRFLSHLFLSSSTITLPFKADEKPSFSPASYVVYYERYGKKKSQNGEMI